MITPSGFRPGLFFGLSSCFIKFLLLLLDNKLPMLKGEKYTPKRNIRNHFGNLLFEVGLVYTVLDVDGDEATLDHTLYGNEYMPYPISYIEDSFNKVKKEDMEITYLRLLKPNK